MRKTLKKLLVSVLLSTGAVLVYYLYGRSMSAVPYGGFSRNFVASPLLSSQAYDLGYNSFYIAGISDGHIYLGNYTAPLHMLVIDSTLEEKKDLLLSLPGIDTWRGPIEIKVDSPYFHVFNGIEPFVYRGTLASQTSVALAKNDSIFFKAGEPLDGTAYVFKAESVLDHKDIIVKRDFKKKILSVHDNVLEKQIDGSFCTDGMLHYSKHHASIVYVYYYRNEFIVADTSLTDIVRLHTIDTIRKARLKVGLINNGRTKTLAAPPFVVNKRSSVYGNLLFIQSNVRANNEKPLVFKNNPVIDVYDLPTGDYLSSFYIPQYEGIRMDAFHVHKSTIVALHDRHLIIYHLDTLAFSDRAASSVLE